MKILNKLFLLAAIAVPAFSQADIVHYTNNSDYKLHFTISSQDCVNYDYGPNHDFDLNPQGGYHETAISQQGGRCANSNYWLEYTVSYYDQQGNLHQLVKLHHDIGKGDNRDTTSEENYKILGYIFAVQINSPNNDGSFTINGAPQINQKRKQPQSFNFHTNVLPW